MSEGIRQESPLVERITPERKAPAGAAIGATLRERPLLGYVDLRGDPDDEAFRQAVSGVIGCDLPVEPNTIAASDGVAALWLGPNEWYLRTAAGAELETVAALERALAGRHAAVNDLTSNLTTIALEGPHARDVLEKGCTLDLHPRAFADGHCAQTLLAKAGVILRPIGGGTDFEIIVRRSFADYVFVWLADAADEFGFAVID